MQKLVTMSTSSPSETSLLLSTNEFFCKQSVPELELFPSAYMILGKLLLLLPFAFLFFDLLFLLGLAPPAPLSGPPPAGGVEDDEVVAFAVDFEQRSG